MVHKDVHAEGLCQKWTNLDLVDGLLELRWTFTTNYTIPF